MTTYVKLGIIALLVGTAAIVTYKVVAKRA
jgi:hypothetical protein